jgi:uncharacterized membrane protein
MYYKKILRDYGKWVLALIFIVLSIINFMSIDAQSHSTSDTIRPFLIETITLAIVFYIILRIMLRFIKPI